MKYFLVILFCLVAPSLLAQSKDLSFYYNQAQEAYRQKVYPKFYEMISEAHKIHPYHQGILYQLGIASVLTGRKEEGIEYLRKAILIDAGFQLEGLADLSSIRESQGFHELLSLQKELEIPVIHSDTAFVLRDRALHTEGIDLNPSTGIFYLGSIHKRKIVSRLPDGTVKDFCGEGLSGMTSIFGIRIDVERNLLWACSSPMQEMNVYDSTLRSAVFKFDLATGLLLQKFQLPLWQKDGVFGDLTLSSTGEVYVSEGQTNTIYKINEKTKQPEPFFNGPDFRNLQGICFSDRDQYLFIADYVKGLFRLDVKTKTLSTIESPSNTSLKGIDGLLWYHQSLITIQNGVSPARVRRWFLDPAGKRIIRIETIDHKHPAFHEPTLGTVVGRDFYYIANSQWGGYDKDHHILPESELQDIVILKSTLKD